MNTYYSRRRTDIQNMFIVKAVVACVIAAALFLLVLLFLPERSAAARKVPAGTYSIASVQIEPGDTLSELASEYYTDDFSSLKKYMAEIKRMNGMESDTLYAGAYLLIPYYSE